MVANKEGRKYSIYSQAEAANPEIMCSGRVLDSNKWSLHDGCQKRGKRMYKSIFCEHCSSSLCKSTWYEHYTQYYCPRMNVWQKMMPANSQSTVDPVNCSDDSQEEVCSILFSAALGSFTCQYLVEDDIVYVVTQRWYSFSPLHFLWLYRLPTLRK